jgi:hypothetical protein
MNFLIGALRIFGIAWLALGSLLILAGIAGTFMSEGFGAVQALMSPFNVINYVAIAVTLAPGIGALMWSDKLKQKRGSSASVT